MEAVKEKVYLYWISFARPRENYVVLEEAGTHQEAVEKAVPLKNFNPREWAMECYQIPSNGEEVKDFEKHKLITEDELWKKGYLKPSELRRN